MERSERSDSETQRIRRGKRVASRGVSQVGQAMFFHQLCPAHGVPRGQLPASRRSPGKYKLGSHFDWDQGSSDRTNDVV